MYVFLQTEIFIAWLKRLKNNKAKARIISRIRSAEAGNFGDVAPVGSGISEMRIHIGSGYRLYFCRKENVVYLLLCGGSKSTQQKDIQTAKRIKKELVDR